MPLMTVHFQMQICVFRSLNFIVVPRMLMQLVECAAVVYHACSACLLLNVDIPQFLQLCLLAICAVLLVLGITHGDVMGFLGWIVGKARPLALRRAF